VSESLALRRSAEDLFLSLWKELLTKKPTSLRFPREIIWLGGAPGSGKSTHTAFIMKRRGITGGPVVVSDLFTSSEAIELKQKGLLVDDSLVVRLLLEKLTDPNLANGVVIDGFPRTPIQVECVKIFYSLLQEMQKNSEPPHFRVVVLYIDNNDSVERQLQRGREVLEHNRTVRETGTGKLKEERPTDVDAEAARYRYQLFYDQTFNSLMALRNQFPFHVINSQGPTTQTQQNILNEIQSTV